MTHKSTSSHVVPTSSLTRGRPRGGDLVPRPHPIGDEVTTGSPTTTTLTDHRARPRDDLKDDLNANPTQRTCRSCGCTDNNACWPPCCWIDTDLCSACS